MKLWNYGVTARTQNIQWMIFNDLIDEWRMHLFISSIIHPIIGSLPTVQYLRLPVTTVVILSSLPDTHCSFATKLRTDNTHRSCDKWIQSTKWHPEGGSTYSRSDFAFSLHLFPFAAKTGVKWCRSPRIISTQSQCYTGDRHVHLHPQRVIQPHPYPKTRDHLQEEIENTLCNVQWLLSDSTVRERTCLTEGG